MIKENISEHLTRTQWDFYVPTHEPQSPAPGEPSGLSKCPLTRRDGSVSCESTDDILPLDQNSA